ncbi:DUF6492 family protein [Nocardioides sp. YIM 152588]|uniref:DUF6492 family protein n=1 Tax=Nocardioides sp. YIM 152588 TaxID=3158259 RepID=UPI0032E433AE
MNDQQAPGAPTEPLTSADVSIVTVSYRGDLAIAQELCRSVDAHLPDGAEHVLVVPRSDLALFEPLAGPSRRVIAVESVLPRGYRKIPAPRRITIGRFSRQVREIWVTPRGVARGWIIQQIVKLSADAITDREIVVFADSDIVLVAPLTLEHLARAGSVRLYRVAGATADLPSHIRWHDVSARLLGLSVSGYTGADYIGNLITWRRSNVLRLQRRLAEVAGRRWDRVIARQQRFSEYILYGIFADLVLGDDESGHCRTADDLVHAGWFYDLTTSDGVEGFLDGFTPGQVGVAIQSTERFTLAERRAMIDRIADGTPGSTGADG